MDYEEENNNYNYGLEQNNEMDEDINNNFNEINDMNDINFDEFDNNNYDDNNIEDDENYNNYNEEEQEPENDIDDENQNNNEKDLYDINMENIKLKDRIQKIIAQKNNELEKIQKILIQKNNEMINKDINYKNQIMKMNQIINKYKIMEKNFNKIQNELIMKNKIISNLQQQTYQGIEDIKDNKLDNQALNDNPNLIFLINKKIKSIEQEILEEPDSDFINQEDFQKLDQDNQIKSLFTDINIFSQKLNEYKNNNMKEIIHLRNLLDSTEIKQQNNINDKFYLQLNDLNKNLTKNNINDIKIPNYSLNDGDEIRKNNILNTNQILMEYIINNKKNNNNTNNTSNNNINQELSKRLNEMADLLSKNNQNLSLATKSNSELKKKYNELRNEFDSFKEKSENDKKKLTNDLNKKNQQIKSLEHINTKLSNQINENKTNEESKNNKKPVNKYGRIKKNNNKKIKDNLGKINLKEDLFIKDEKSEKTLEKFLNEYSNGEYGNYIKNKQKENFDIDNLKNEIENFKKKLIKI